MTVVDDACGLSVIYHRQLYQRTLAGDDQYQSNIMVLMIKMLMLMVGNDIRIAKGSDEHVIRKMVVVILMRVLMIVGDCGDAGYVMLVMIMVMLIM